MVKKSIVVRNNKRHALCDKFKERRIELKRAIYDKSISLNDRYNLIMKLSKQPRNVSKVRLRNRCSITARGRGYYRAVGLSRCMFRKYAGEAMLFGFKKSSW